jgi:hypothetical protein
MSPAACVALIRSNGYEFHHFIASTRELVYYKWWGRVRHDEPGRRTFGTMVEETEGKTAALTVHRENVERGSTTRLEASVGELYKDHGEVAKIKITGPGLGVASVFLLQFGDELVLAVEVLPHQPIDLIVA